MNLLDRRPVRRVEFAPPDDPPPDLERWPWTLPPVGVLKELADAGGQVLVAAHSPLVAALPGATARYLRHVT